MSDTIEAKTADYGSGGNPMYEGAMRDPDKWLDRYIAASANSIFTITAELTPERAAALLRRNPDNRKISERIVRRYAADIVDGRWEHNGETIIVSDTGELNDGQHRCAAVIEAGTPIVTQITFGVKRGTRVTLDGGIKRTVAQHLGMSGHVNTKLLAHAASIIMIMEKYGKIVDHVDYRPNATEVIEWVESHPEINDFLLRGKSASQPFKASGGLFAALLYEFSKISPEDASVFFEKLAKGDNLSATDPIFRLRNQLIKNLGETAKLPYPEIAARVIKAWNAYRKGRSMKALGRRRKGVGAEDFPIPE